MPKNLLKIVGIIILTILEPVQSNFDLAKKSLIEREKEFIKTRPLSEDLRSFIAKYKKKPRIKRDKSAVGAEESMYILQDGHLVPFKNVANMQGYLGVQSENRKSDVGSFTVVPLVVPLVSNQEQGNKLVKPRNSLNDDIAPPLPGQALAPPEPAVPSAAAPVSQESSSSAPAPPPEPEEGDDNDNKTQEETEILHKILQDVQGLMQWKHEGNRKEGVLCNLNGSWISDAAGMRFDICFQNSTRKKFRIHVADRIPPNEDGFLCDGNWTVFGELPFMHSGVVIALAVHAKDRHIATFIGECRVCEGSETVTGTWLVGRSSRDCKDQKAAHKVLADVWKRERAHTLRKKHLQQLGITDVKDEDK